MLYLTEDIVFFTNFYMWFAAFHKVEINKITLNII